MGCFVSSSEKVEPQIPEKENFNGTIKERSCTDVIWIVIMACFVITLFGLMIHCYKYGDVYRVINGYDNCGNVCGRVTSKEDDPAFSCKGANYTEKKYLLIKEASKLIVNPRNLNKECVADCKDHPGFKKFLRRCIPEKTAEVVNQFFSTTGLQDFFLEINEDLNFLWVDFVYICLYACVFLPSVTLVKGGLFSSVHTILLSIQCATLSIMMLILLRYVAWFMLFFVSISVLSFAGAGTAFLWYLYNKSSHNEDRSDISNRKTKTYLAFAILATIFFVVIVVILIAMKKRVQLVKELFIEASKAIAKMPLLLFQPFLTMISILLVMTAWISFSVLIESSGYLHDGSPSFYYKKDLTMKVTRWYNLLAMFWMVQFCIGCQQLVIAGSVAEWFFTRNKDKLDSPVATSYKRLLRYHLGSVALGSLLVGFIQFLRAVLTFVQAKLKDADNAIGKAIFRSCQCCLYCFEKCLKFITRNAYIEMAIYGNNFCWSGEQAVKVIVSNSMRVFAINCVGDFILFLCKVLIVFLSLLLSTLMFEKLDSVHHLWAMALIAILFSYFVANCFIGVYEMVIDSIFICFCEDCEINDGITKPYYMNAGLMEFVQKSNKLLASGSRTEPTTLETPT